MKKVLVTLLVLAVAVSGVFAAVNFSGSLTSGYVIQNANNEWTSWVFGDDNKDTNSTTLKLNIADENGYWSGAIEGALYVDGSNVGDSHQNRVSGDITVDLAKIIAGPDTDWSAQLQLLAYDRVTGLRAYTNKSGLNFDRVRTAEPGLWANAIVGYGKLIQFQVGGAPELSGKAEGLEQKPYTQTGEVIISAMTEPLDGLRVSVDWALVGDRYTREPGKENLAKGVVGGAADINIGALCGLDFDLGVGIADKYYYGEQRNVLAAQIYGGIDLFSIFGEYVLEAGTSRLHFGLDLNVLEGLVLNFYGGAGSLAAAEAASNWYVGTNVGYEIYGITFQVNVQYAAYAEGGHSYLHGDGGDKGGDIAQGAVKADGFSITPMVKVSF